MKSNKKVILAIMLVILSLLTFSVLVSCTATVEYKLDFIVDGEVYHTINTPGETIIAMPQNPTKEGYTFDGWYWDDNAWKKPFTANSLLEAPLSSDMKVFAKFTEQNEELTGLGIRAKGFTKQETVLNTSVRNSVDSFNFNDYIEVKNDSKWTVCLDMMCKDIIPSKMILLEPGENTIYILVTDSSENICVYTVKIYRNKMITINFENNFENTIDSFEIEEGQPIGDIVEPRKTGYKFIKWTNNNEDINANTIIDANKTYCLVAKFEPNTYTISFIKDSTKISGKTVTYDTMYGTLPVIEEKTGYTGKWMLGNEEITSSSIVEITNNVELIAEYIPNTYTISFVKDGTKISEKNVTYDSTYGILPTVDIGGYTYKWKLGNEEITSSSIVKIIGNVTIEAEWTPIKYDLILMDGEQEYFRTTYSIEENVDLTTKVPVKEGYTFDKWYTSIDGIEIKEFIDLGSTGDITLYANYIHNGYINKSRATEIIIPEKMNGEKITSIESEEFRLCTSLTSITIPSSVKSIEEYAFYGCSSLKRVNISNIESWLNISFGSISANPLSNGAKLYINNEEVTTIEIPNTITEVKAYAFYRCSSLTNITIPSSVTSIGNSAFSGCSSLTSITMSNNVKSIGYGAFSGCSSLTSITIPSSVTSIDGNAFSGCRSLANIEIPSSVTSIEYGAFYGCSSLTSIVVNPNNTVYDSRNNCNAIIEISTNTLLLGCQNTTIPNTVTSIGYGAFDGCSSLTSIEIPSSVTSIGCDAFYGCSSLTSIEIPSSVTSIEYGAFYGCSSLTSITIPSSVTSIDGNAFSGCSSLTSIVVNPNNTVYDSRNNCNAIIEISTNTLLLGCQNTTIPNTVTSIGRDAFDGCSSLTSIEIPSSVTSIGGNAFYGCSSLKRVNISTIESWLNISFDGSDANPLYYGAKLYINDEEVTTIEMPDTITEINSYAFYGCSSLTRIIFGENSQLTSIGYDAFEKCSNLQYNIYQGMKYFGTETNPYAFLVGITDMFQTSFIIHDETERIIKIFDFGNLSCASITIPSGVKYISEDAFDDWDEVLVEIYNKSNIDLTETDCLGNNIYGLDNVKNIYTGEGGSKLFAEGDFLVYKNGQENILIKYLGTNYRVVIPEGITAINCYAFAYAPVLMIEIPASINQTEIVLLGAHIFEARNKSAATIYIQTMAYEGPLKNVYTETEGESKIKTTTDYVYYEDNGEKILLKYLSSEEYIVVPNDISIVHIDTIKMLLLEMGMLSANEFPAIYVDENNIDAIIIELEFGIIPINEIFTLVESDKTGYKKYVLNLEN